MDQGEREVISVAELAQRLRRSVERVTGHEWVEGEVGSFKQAGSGHLYFSLKDEREEATIDCVIYRSQAVRARRHVFPGSRIQVLGRATFWAPRGRLQLMAEAVRRSGLGQQLEALEQLKLALKAEGLFAPEKKRTLPSHARYVGVVTSLHGAALHDIRSVAFRRARVVLVVSPCVVQGETAPQSVVAALDLIDRDPRLDVVIVGRGGGSGEDLMAYNDERVVRRVAQLHVPVISAVGHETDVTLTDLVADVRAATPSQAAELAVQDRSAQGALVVALRSRLLRVMPGRLRDDQMVLERLRGRLGDPRFLIAERQQLLDDYRFRLRRAAERRITRRRERLVSVEQRLFARHPRVVIARAQARLSPLLGELTSGCRVQLARRRSRLGTLAARLDALSPLPVLARGYSVTTRADGSIVRRATATRLGEALMIRLHEGALGVSVTEIRQPEPAALPKLRTATDRSAGGRRE